MRTAQSCSKWLALGFCGFNMNDYAFAGWRINVLTVSTKRISGIWSRCLYGVRLLWRIPTFLMRKYQARQLCKYVINVLSWTIVSMNKPPSNFQYLAMPAFLVNGPPFR